MVVPLRLGLSEAPRIRAPRRLPVAIPPRLSPRAALRSYRACAVSFNNSMEPTRPAWCLVLARY